MRLNELPAPATPEPKCSVGALKALTGLQVCRGIFLDVGLDFGKHVGHLHSGRKFHAGYRRMTPLVMRARAGSARG